MNRRKSLFFAAVCLSGLALGGLSAPVQVRVGLYVLHFGRFDVGNGSYTVDFYLSLQSEKPLADLGSIEFMNGRAASTDVLINTPTEVFLRIQANLSQNIDLRRYPFDRHALSIELEHKKYTSDQVVFVPDPRASGVDLSVIVVGWDLTGWDAQATEHVYEVYRESFSRFVFNLNIQRVFLSAVIKSLLPVGFMILVGLLSLLLTPDKVLARLSMNVSTLLGAVMFHINLTSSIPPVGYLTLADRVMITTYAGLFAVLVSSVLLLRRADEPDKTAAQRIYRSSLLLVPTIVVVLYLTLLIRA